MISLLFGFARPVDRKTYLVTGLVLMALKYAAEAVLVHSVTGQWWTPADFLNPQLKSRFLDGPPLRLFVHGPLIPPHVPSWLPWTLMLWTFPFIWIGVSMSVRRAAHAGLSPWLGLLFMVPYANYALMLLLCVMPASRRQAWAPPRSVAPGPAPVGTIVACGAAGIGAALCMIAVPTLVMKSYGAHLFLGAPLVFGCLTAFLFNLGMPATWGRTCGVVLASLLVLGLVFVAVAFEGLICICMALPIAVPLSLVGAAVGRAIALCCPTSVRQALIVVIAVPFLAAFESRRELPIHEVRSSIEIDAAPAVVWERLLAFGEIRDPPEWVFRAGVACPIGARIEGTGVGAVRFCEFSTGAFVEPITVWDPPRRLAFDVAEQPPPMIEWSPYDIHPPHLDGFLRSRRGEFRLVELPGGRTRLEGSTWYTLDIHPGPYWRLYADFLVSEIHERVLRHVRRRCETR